MRFWVSLVLSLAIPVFGQGKMYEKKAMNLIKSEAWLSVLGNWDKDGFPQILDMSLINGWNSNLFSQQNNPYQIETKGLSGASESFGVEVVKDSGGGKETWYAHLPLIEPYVSFNIFGPGRKSLPVRLEAEGEDAPGLKVWEEDGGKFRWEASVGWQVQVDATANEGESWVALGTGKNGSGTLAKVEGGMPAVVRIQCFRGLRCYADIYMPGTGILEQPLFYLQPTCFQVKTKVRGVLSTYPCFEFYPGGGRDIASYVGRAKTRWDLGRLPFNVAKLFPGKNIQMVFQVEWVNPTPPSERAPVARFGQNLFRDPMRIKGLMLSRVVLRNGGWMAEEMKKLGQYDGLRKAGIISDCEDFRSPIGGTLDFHTYWVITSN